MTELGTLWRTVRHLKAQQVLGRARFRLTRPTPDLRAAPALRSPVGASFAPAMREPSLLPDARFRFLNETRALDNIGWDDPSVDRLWRYNQHYFDDLNASGAAARVEQQRALVARWIEENPPAVGTGWEPFPTSLRIVNWVKWFIGGVPAEPAWLYSLAVQARWLAARIEWHLLGNHLFANAKALVFAGLFFDGAEADTWLGRGLAILRRELPEQVLADGGQFERSPMYHALALEDVLDLLSMVAQRAPAASPARRFEPDLREVAARMLHWQRAMSHPDGSIGLFNDAASGIAPSNAELERLAAALGITAPGPAAEGITQLDASGYLRVARDDAVALLDVAPVGPDYLPGHAHADTLSFELSIGTRRIVVNGGTSCYGSSARRHFERGTAAHSTVQVAGENSSEVWSGFRVGRRARPVNLKVGAWNVDCAHDGYRHLPGQSMHRRQWLFGARELTVTDSVSPSAPAVARYHLAPGLHLQPMRSDQWQVRQGESVVAQVSVEAGTASATESLHAPHFGMLEAAQTLEVTLHDGRAVTQWRW